MAHSSFESSNFQIPSEYGTLTLTATPEGVAVDQQAPDHRQPDDPFIAVIEKERIATLGSWLCELPAAPDIPQASYVDNPDCLFLSRHWGEIQRSAILILPRSEKPPVFTQLDRHIEAAGLGRPTEYGIAYAAQFHDRLLLEVEPHRGPLPATGAKWLGEWMLKDLAHKN